MADVFSQKDIDSLLKGASPVVPSDGPVEVIPYNFLRPPRIAKDRQALLNGIYQRIAVSLQALFSSRLRTAVDVVLSSVEQATFAEFIFSLATPCAAYVYELGDKVGGQAALDLGTDFSYYLLDRLFGGPGESQDIKRPLTLLERTVVRGDGGQGVGPGRGGLGRAPHLHPGVRQLRVVPRCTADRQPGGQRAGEQYRGACRSVLRTHHDVRAAAVARSRSCRRSPPATSIA